MCTTVASGPPPSHPGGIISGMTEQTAPEGPVRLAAVIELPAEHLESAQRYEDEVLTLLAGYDGELERRLRSTDGRTEVHLLRFPTRAAYESFMHSPERIALRASFGEAAPAGRVLEVDEI